MCKIAIIAGLDPKNKDTNWEFIEELGALMSKGNDDGLGYTAVDAKGNIFGERWLYNDNAFDVRLNMTSLISKFQGFLKGSLEPTYNKFGTYTDEISAITLHTRMATNKVALENVHPFVDLSEDTSVIHNGVINNWTVEDNIRSTCDSERILNQYLDKSIAKNPSRFQSMVDELKGYFACGVISRDENGTRIIDVFRSRANLGAVFVKELNALVITTDVSLVNKVAKDYGYHILGRFEVQEDMLLRLDALTGRPMLAQVYKDTAAYVNNVRQWRSEADVQSSSEQAAKKIQGLIDHELANTKTTTKTYDPLNEEAAAKDGYTRTKDNIWVKRKELVN